MAQKKSSTGFSLKDHLFNRDSVKLLATLLENGVPGFASDAFVRQVLDPFNKLELKERIVHIASVLEKHLDADFRIAAKQISAALPPPLDPKKTDDDFGDFIIAPLGEYVVRNGLTKRNLKISLRTLREITKRFSMEFAIRKFIVAFPLETLGELQKWADDKNYHVRRLVSEGTRPSLPWSGKISIDRSVAISFLDQLHADQTRYVTRSVCNHLNDISKTDEKLVVDTLKRWKKQKQQESEELKWMCKHALRTLVKRGDKGALTFLGYRSNPKVEVVDFKILPSSISPGETIEFSFDLLADRKESLIVDYVVEFVKANGSLGPKVHKLKTLEVSKGESVTILKRHRFLANATTYTLYPGTHYLTIQINGESFGRIGFEIT
jgi:3-methyladenine DNA glycosylase AlkC